MLLAVDIGNTNIVIGVFDKTTLVQSWRLHTVRDRTADELGVLVDGLFSHSRIARSGILGVIVSSVVAPLTAETSAMVDRFFGLSAVIVDPATNTGMPVLYERPEELGADRIVSAIAAYELFGKGRGRPLIVCDFGTATTLDGVTAKGEFLGGAICPGLVTQAEGLFDRVPRLPRIEVRKPATAIGRSAVGSLQSGLFLGYMSMIEGLVGRLGRELGGKVICIATGGLAGLIAPETTVIDHVDRDLMLHGLRIIWDRQIAD